MRLTKHCFTSVLGLSSLRGTFARLKSQGQVICSLNTYGHWYMYDMCMWGLLFTSLICHRLASFAFILFSTVTQRHAMASPLFRALRWETGAWELCCVVSCKPLLNMCTVSTFPLPWLHFTLKLASERNLEYSKCCTPTRPQKRLYSRAN